MDCVFIMDGRILKATKTRSTFLCSTVITATLDYQLVLSFETIFFFSRIRMSKLGLIGCKNGIHFECQQIKVYFKSSIFYHFAFGSFFSTAQEYDSNLGINRIRTISERLHPSVF